MIENLTFLNDKWLWPVCIPGLLIWLIFIWKEHTNFGKPKFYLNSIIALFVVASLVFIVLKPMIRTIKASQQMILLTNGYEQEQLDSLIRSNKGIRIESYQMDRPIFKNNATSSYVHVLGNGVRPFDLWQFDSLPSTYSKGNHPQGVTRIKYNSSFTEGETETLKGIYSNAISGHSLILQGPSGIDLDSVELTTQTIQEFELKIDSKISGNFLFNLIEKDSIGNIISTDPVPVTILEQVPLKIMIINGSPTFEIKYLKNFLADAGHEVVVRSRLTKSRYKYEYFNLITKPSVSFSEKNLEQFDLIILDAVSTRNLSDSALNTLESSISTNGLGLFIQPDPQYLRGSPTRTPFNFLSNKIIETSIEERSAVKISKYPYQFKTEPRIEIMLRSNSELLAAYKRQGRGRIGTSLLQNTYELVLNGQTDTYAYLWKSIIKSLSKREVPSSEWNSKTLIAYKDQPFKFQLRTNFETPVIYTNDGVNIPMRRHIDIATLWEGTTFPKATGWRTHSLEQDSSMVFNYYVTDSTNWQSVNAFNDIQANKRYFSEKDSINAGLNKASEPINPIWFYLVFILGMGFLWLEPKL
jgi:hypothetical protein